MTVEDEVGYDNVLLLMVSSCGPSVHISRDLEGFLVCLTETVCTNRAGRSSSECFSCMWRVLQVTDM